VTLPATPGRVLLDRHDIARAVTRLAGEIEADFPDGVVLVGVLKGALLFLADLARAMRNVDVTIDFLAISRYAPDSGRVRIVQDVAVDLSDRDVVIVEDLVDTGLTLAYLEQHLERIGARRVEVCALLDRATRRIVPIAPRYVGVTVGDAFVLGYGLHFHDRYRNLSQIVEVDRQALEGERFGYRDASSSDQN
jgi:hypoxanthine phosphoribosyltransferase